MMMIAVLCCPVLCLLSVDDAEQEEICRDLHECLLLLLLLLYCDDDGG
jgi:hypothetical protein